MKVLGNIFLSSNAKYFYHYDKKIQKVLCLWNSGMLTLEGKMMIFKTLEISKMVYLALMTNVPKVIAEELQKIPKNSCDKNHVLK